MSPSSPIVVIDSGLGGLTVVRAIQNVLPKEDIVYFGDTARLPYGSKTAATVCSFVQQIISFLQSTNPKHVVIACNTATALALAVRPAYVCQFADHRRHRTRRQGGCHRRGIEDGPDHRRPGHRSHRAIQGL